MKKIKKRIRKAIHKYFSIPKYEKELKEKDGEIAELEMHVNYFKQNAYKYRNKLAKIKNDELKKKDKGVKND